MVIIVKFVTDPNVFLETNPNRSLLKLQILNVKKPQTHLKLISQILVVYSIANIVRNKMKTQAIKTVI